jgi:hypothetical protein
VAQQTRRSRHVDIEGWEHKAFISVLQSAAILDLGKTRTWDLVYSGAIPSVKHGASRKVVVAGLKAYILRLTEETNSCVKASRRRTFLGGKLV